VGGVRAGGATGNAEKRAGVVPVSQPERYQARPERAGNRVRHAGSEHEEKEKSGHRAGGPLCVLLYLTRLLIELYCVVRPLFIITPVGRYGVNTPYEPSLLRCSGPRIRPWPEGATVKTKRARYPLEDFRPSKGLVVAPGSSYSWRRYGNASAPQSRLPGRVWRH
jgi:hypothetical protein